MRSPLCTHEEGRGREGKYGHKSTSSVRALAAADINGRVSKYVVLSVFVIPETPPYLVEVINFTHGMFVNFL